MEISHSYRLFGQVIVLLMFLLSSIPQDAVHADIGWPPINTSGSSLEVAEGERTNVRMMEEEVSRCSV